MSTPEILPDYFLKSGLPAGRIPEVRVLPAPSGANVHGDVFGGGIMAQVDIAGPVQEGCRHVARDACRALGLHPK